MELPSQMENHYQLHVIDIIYPLEHPPPLYIISPESWLDGVGFRGNQLVLFSIEAQTGFKTGPNGTFQVYHHNCMLLLRV